MTDHTSNADPLDSLLADYLDWLDHGHARDVDVFLASRPRAGHDTRLAERLRDYVESARAIEELAAVTTASWIDGEHASGATDTAVRSRQVMPSRSLPADFGEYELLEEIGRGGMGVVYRARHKPLDRIVCLKMILSGQMADRRDVERFLGEAQSMARMRHPNLVTVYEVGRHDGQDYFSMEYIQGRTLADRGADPLLPPDQAARYLQAIAQAIQYVHEHQILHRDLKPANVLIDPSDQPRVTDFGLARQIDAGSLTRTGTLVGTPAYMPPEQTRGNQHLDARSDVYGLGALLYDLLTGRPPFRGETPLDTLLQVRQQEPLPPRVLNPVVPRDLETICLKCLEKDPARRYLSAAAMAGDLGRFLRREPILARPIGPVDRCFRWCRRNPLLFGSAAAVLLSLVSIAVVASVAYRTTASALVDTQTARDEQAHLASQLRRERDAAENHLYVAQIHRVRQAIEKGDLFEAEELLRQLIPRPPQADRRGWEWHYLRGLLRQYERSLDAGTGRVHALAWSPDGHQLASIGEDQALRLWDAASGAELQTSEQLPEGPVDVAWSPSGDRIATATLDDTVQIWDVTGLKLLHDLRHSQAKPRSLAWSPSGSRLAVAYESGEVAVWNPSAAEVERTLSGHQQRVNSVRWDHHGNRLATSSDDGTVRLWSAARGSCIAVLRGSRDWIHAVAWSRDDSRVAAVAQDGTLLVWSLREDGDSELDGLIADELYTRITRERKPLLGVAWSEEDHLLVTSGVSPRLQLWDAATGSPLYELRGHQDTAVDVEWNPSRPRLASASADGTVKIWATDVVLPGAPLKPAGSPVRSVVSSAQGNWLAWRDVDGLVSVWDAQANRRVLEFPESVLGATSLAWHPVEPQLALARENTVVVFSIPSGQETLRLQGHEGPVWSIEWDSSGKRIATGSNDRRLIVWSAETRQKLLTRGGHDGDVRCIAWSRDGRHLATADTRAVVRIWQAEDGTLARTLTCDTTSINDLAWSPDSRWLAAAAHEGAIWQWEVSSGDADRQLAGHQGDVWSLDWSHDGRRIFSSGQDGTIRVWDPKTRQELLQLTGHDGPIWSLDLAPGGRLCTSGVDGTVRIWWTDPGRVDRPADVEEDSAERDRPFW